MNAADHYAVMGNPIAHSKSPFIHQRFAEQTGQSIHYEAILVDSEGFTDAVKAFADSGGKGLNITVPFKQEAWQLADRRSARAEHAGAVNTLVIEADGSFFADNTDGIGLVRDLNQNLGVSLTQKRILLLGAGGAARGVLAPLLEQQPQQLIIANRTIERAQQLAEKFSDFGHVQGCGFNALSGHFDIIINATAAGLQGEVPPLPNGLIGSHSCCYDMVYGTEPTAFVCYAREKGAGQAVDGLGMLVEQAAESFRIWRGVTPQTATVINELRR